MEYFTTGQFAKLANVSERTLRYYDKIGLLKPSKIKKNGYRNYSKDDLFRLQKIILLKKLGFPLEEITIMLVENDEGWVDTLRMQVNLVDQKIRYFSSLKETLKKAIEIVADEGMSLKKTVDLLNLLSSDEEIVEQYRNATNLRVRIQLHHLYSTNPVEWFSWLRQKIDFSKINRLLELGCGNGDLWIGNAVDLRNREIFLSDLSEGMLEDAKSRLSDEYSFMQMDAQNIPFKKDFFDAVVANHLLFYLSDLPLDLSEITRVLKKSGVFYASTYGKSHMKEINELAQEFDSRIRLSTTFLPEQFGKENGKEILSRYFDDVERFDYTDTLVIDQAKPVVDYIVSCHGNQNEILSGRLHEFYEFVRTKIENQGSITATKEACLFIAQNKKSIK